MRQYRDEKVRDGAAENTRSHQLSARSAREHMARFMLTALLLQYSPLTLITSNPYTDAFFFLLLFLMTVEV
jgi:hypothetical protein